MRKRDLDRVVFYSKEDMAGGDELHKGESILKTDTKHYYTDINEVLELYNLKKYIDNEVYLKVWTEEDIAAFKQKAVEYGKAIGQYMATVTDKELETIYPEITYNYVHSFWEIVNNQGVYKRISKSSFSRTLSNEAYLIHEIIKHKNIVSFYDKEIKNFLLEYTEAAEILLTFYEVKDDYRHEQKYLPKSLTVEDKELIISSYLDSGNVNYNYIELIQNAKNRKDFTISDKTRLKAKRLHISETEKFFEGNTSTKYSVTISFPKNLTKIKDSNIEDGSMFNLSYNLDYIEEHNDPYTLFINFKDLFEYIDDQNRITLTSKKSQMGVLERNIGVHSQNFYRLSNVFQFTEMASKGQVYGYEKIVRRLNTSLESVLHHVFTKSFQEKYGFADNARFYIPSATSYLEKVRLLAPEFESVLKQFKLFVENGEIDFELLQMTSAPSSLKNIPSLNPQKYIYFNPDNEEMLGCSNLLFSDQTLLAYLEPFKEKNYTTFFNLLANEQVKYSSYEDYQKPKLEYLISKNLIAVDEDDYIEIINAERVILLHDLYVNEVSSYYHYLPNFQEEIHRMVKENIVYFESSLFSRPEQAYLNYYLNKSEFTNGLDLRNSYLHGTQANSDETEKHEMAYFAYLKIFILALLKIDDDLLISRKTNSYQ